MCENGARNSVAEPHDWPELRLLESVLELSDPFLRVLPMRVLDRLLVVEVPHLFEADDLAT